MKLTTILMSTASAVILAGGVAAQDVSTDSDTGMNSGAEVQATDDTAVMGADGQVGVEDTATVDPGAAAPAPDFTSLEGMTVGDVLGMKVTDPTFAEIGDIDYIVPDGESASAVIGIGGFLGLGEYTVALPISDFIYDAEQRVLVLHTDKETLKTHPEFDESGAESLPDETPVASLMPDDASATSDKDDKAKTGSAEDESGSS